MTNPSFLCLSYAIPRNFALNQPPQQVRAYSSTQRPRKRVISFAIRPKKKPPPPRMPSLRRKKDGLSTSTSPARVSSRNSPSRLAVVKTPMKSPLRHVRHAGITKNQKSVLLENLNLESTFERYNYVPEAFN